MKAKYSEIKVLSVRQKIELMATLVVCIAPSFLPAVHVRFAPRSIIIACQATIQ